MFYFQIGHTFHCAICNLAIDIPLIYMHINDQLHLLILDNAIRAVFLESTRFTSQPVTQPLDIKINESEKTMVSEKYVSKSHIDAKNTNGFKQAESGQKSDAKNKKNNVSDVNLNKVDKKRNKKLKECDHNEFDEDVKNKNEKKQTDAQESDVRDEKQNEMNMNLNQYDKIKNKRNKKVKKCDVNDLKNVNENFVFEGHLSSINLLELTTIWIICIFAIIHTFLLDIL